MGLTMVMRVCKEALDELGIWFGCHIDATRISNLIEK